MNTKKKIRFENIICLYEMMNEIASKKMTANGGGWQCQPNNR